MIIFDCDGVLVDSEILSNQIDAELMTAVGYPITAAELIAEYIGRPKRDIWNLLAELRGEPWPEHLFETAERRLIEAIDTELQPVAGVAEVLAALSPPIAVASSSGLPKLRRALERTGLIGFFEPRIFSASQVARGKPAPDVFLFAAAQCGVAPTDCIVIEDSGAGVEAALAAGMRVIGFTGGRHTYAGHADRLRRHGAEVIVEHMRDLPAQLPGPAAR